MMTGDQGDSYSNFIIARALHTGTGLPDGVVKNWILAFKKYSEIIEDRTEIGTPIYMLMQYQAEMKTTGGHGLKIDHTAAAEFYEWAAEEATNAMKGKQAAKYYEMAEISWGMVE